MKKFKILFFISILLISYSSYNIFDWLKDKNNNEKLENNIKEVINLNNNSTTTTIDFNKLLKQNKDTVAWIQVNGTDIDYPVVQSNDNEYYLNHSFNNSSNKSGWIFSDFRNNLKYLNNNTVIYGHGRVDNSMFGSLRKVITDEWFNNKNYIINLYIPNENMIWEIFSVYTILNEKYYITTHFDSSISFQKFIDTIVNRSIFDFSTNITTDDKILTLSTCKNDYNMRIVVHAKLIKKETLIK